MNCIGKQIANFLHSMDNVNCHHIINYIEMKSDTSPTKYNEILQKCDYFIYQPMNKHHNKNLWYPKNLFQYLSAKSIKIKVGYYRFCGFWLNPKYKSDCEEEFVIDKKTIIENFHKGINKLRLIDNDSDIKMFSFFEKNYRDTKLFHDCFHPTNFFIKEMCEQIAKIMGKSFINIILPELDINKMEINIFIKKTLNLTF